MIEEDRSLLVRDVDEAEPAAGEVRVRVEACGICGSDLHLRPSADQLPTGSIMGHELAGLVDRIGDGVDGWSEGDRVCVHPFAPREEHDIEAAMHSGIGLGQLRGAYAESVCVDASMLWRLPDEVPLEHGALVEPLAVGLHGLNVGGVSSEDPCAVIGAGPIGLMVCVALRARGVERFVVVERSDERRRKIEELGFVAIGVDEAQEQVVDRLGEAPRVVPECAGSEAATGLAIELVATSGTVALLGVLEEPVPIPQLLVVMKEAQLRGAFAYRPGDFDEAIELLRTGRVPAEQIVTARAPLEQAQAMFHELERPGTEQLKVLLRPGEA